MKSHPKGELKPHHSIVEEFGVDPVPKAQRTKGWFDLFVIYSGLNISVLAFLFGGILVPGLSWQEVLFVLIAGNGIVGFLMAFIGHMGVDQGLPSTVLSRIFLGHPVGTKIVSMVLLISLTGWFAIQSEVGALALNRILENEFGFSSPKLTLLVLTIGNVIVSIIGIESIKWLSRLSLPLLLGVMFWILYRILADFSYTELTGYEATGEVSITTGIDWMIAGWFVGVFIAADFSRHVKSRRDNLIGTWFGIVPLAVVLTIIGALSALATGDWNPVNHIEMIGLGAPALIVIVFSTWTTNDINIYSAGLSLTNILPKLPRWVNTSIIGVVGALLALSGITERIVGFLELLSILFGPLVGIALTDYFLIRKAKVDAFAVSAGSKAVRYTGGVNPAAVISLLVGIFITAFIPTTYIPSLISLFITAGIYFLLMKKFYPAQFS